jgi:beta-glucosidase
MILLQNNTSVLPLPAGLKLAVFGNSSYEIVTGGTGSGNVNEAYSISLLQGLTTAGFSTHGQLEESYTDFINTAKAEQPPPQRFTPTPMLPERPLSSDEVSKIAAETDMALITIGRNSGEFADRKAEDDFYLSAVEKSLLTTVSEAFHGQKKRVVVVLNIGGVIETASWRDQADAILLAWQPGQEAGYAIADVLSGKVNPSGKLATTFSISLDDFPSAKNYPGVVLEESDPDDPEARFGAKAAEIVYQDGHRVGYRAMNSNDIRPAYEFGFGLSYTQFTFGDLKLSSGHLEDKLTASITITNSGQVAGKEVVQLYISAPESSSDKPEAELRAFEKTRLLQPQESQTLTFEITDAELVSFDPAASKWVADAGEYTLQVGASSIDIRATVNFQKHKQVALSP